MKTPEEQIASIPDPMLKVSSGGWRCLFCDAQQEARWIKGKQAVIPAKHEPWCAWLVNFRIRK